MKKELFDDLLEGVREGGQILRGERAPARAFAREEHDVEKHPEAVFDVVLSGVEKEHA